MKAAAGARLPEIGLLLAGSLCLLPFLMPYHELPLKTFHAEWLAAVLGISAALARTRRAFRPPRFLARADTLAGRLCSVPRPSGGIRRPALSSIAPACRALCPLGRTDDLARSATDGARSEPERVATVLAAFLLPVLC